MIVLISTLLFPPIGYRHSIALPGPRALEESEPVRSISGAVPF